MNEADTCRTYVLPKLKAAGWEDETITEQLVLTPGRKVNALWELQSQSGKELSSTLRSGYVSQSALMPRMLDKAFKGEL